MNNYLLLLRKDYYLLGKLKYLLLVISVAIPMYINRTLSSNNSGNFASISLTISIIYIQYLCYTTISQKEEKYDGRMILSCCPFTRKKIALSSYILHSIISLFCLIVYLITSYLLPESISRLGLFDVVFSLLIATISFSIFIPLDIKFGFNSIKFMMMGTLFIMTVIVPYITTWTLKYQFNVNYLFSMNNSLKLLVLLIVQASIVFISTKTSVRLMRKKEF